jgi:purine-cytosine permease-like protein
MFQEGGQRSGGRAQAPGQAKEGGMTGTTAPAQADSSVWAERQEDYALRYVPAGYRRWGAASLTGVMMGVATAMFFLAWGGQLATSYGTIDTLIGMVFGAIFIGALSYYLARIASATGLDSDLITRGSGFGFMGSAFTSLIYTFNFLMFFAFEGTIMATAVHDRWPAVPMAILYLLIGLVFIPLTWWGLTVMNWLMWVTVPIYLAFLGWTVVLAATSGSHVPFWPYQPAHPTLPEAGPPLLQVLASVLALISQSTIAADIGRFIPASKRTSGALAVGFVSQLLTFCGVTMLGAWFTLSFGGSTNPGAYLASLLGTWGVVFVITTQLRINVTNVYSGSLAYANFFCRVFHVTPGRQYWVILTAAAGTALMFGGIFNHLNAVLTFEGVFVMAWVMAVVSDIAVNKRLLKLSPSNFLYKRSHTYQFNPVGVGALLGALAVAVPLAFGVAGPLGKTLAPFLSGAIAFAAAPVLAALTRGRYYQPATVARNLDPALPAVGAGAPEDVAATKAPEVEHERCVVCRQRFELAEFVSCPFHRAPICSVCCAAHRSCGELCKSPQGLRAGDPVLPVLPPAGA